MAPRKGKGIISSGATSKKASPLPPKTTEPAVPLTPEELIQRELKRPGFKTPLTILNERCQRLNWERSIANVKQNGPFFTPTIILRRHTKKSQNSPIEECALAPHPALKCATALEARHMGAVYALFRFNSGQPLSMQLPPHFRPYWTELTKEKSMAEQHRAWEWADDPFNARKAVTDRQEKKKTNDATKAAAKAADPLGGSGGPVLTSGQMERLPEVKMIPALRELVEETIKNQMLAFPDAILQATKESSGQSNSANGSPSGDSPSINIDTQALNVSLAALGFRPAHVKSVISFLLKAKARVEQGGNKSGEPLDPLVLSLSTLSPEEAAIEWLILHLPEDDLPRRFRPSESVADFISSSRSSTQKRTLVQTWLVDKLIKVVGFPRKAIEDILQLDIGDLEWQEGEVLEALGRRLVGWEDGEWGVEGTLARLRLGGEQVDLEGRDQRRAEEIEALESVFDDRLLQAPLVGSSPITPEITIAIPPLSKKCTDDITLHILYPSPALSSPYPSAAHPSTPPPFFLTSSTLPSYIRLHLHALLLRQFQETDREDLRGTLQSGEGGVVFAMVEFLEGIWESIIEDPPSVGLVTQFLVPKLPPAAPKGSSSGPRTKSTANRTQRPRRIPSPDEQAAYKAKWEEWQNSKQFQKVLDGRKSLPAWKEKEIFLEALATNRVLVVIGETGSGKTTQLPQFILDHEIANLRGCSTSIMVTQPRRVSALGVAARVAQERLEDVDRAVGSVGYAIRGERRAGPNTKLMFCTTGVLLRRLSAGGDANLDGVSHVVVDEVHERSVDGDFLLLELRELLKRNKTIKIVLMSATINHLTFTNYFAHPEPAPLLEIHGRTFPVEDNYLEDIIKDVKYRPAGNARPSEKQTEEQLKSFRAEYESIGLRSNDIQTLDTVSRSEKVDAVLTAAVVQYAIGKADDGGGVLVFCPGVQEITQTIQALKALPLGPVNILPLHAQLSSQDQKRVFVPPTPGVRKIVVSTNVAETSITIDDITMVVDTGKVKETRFEPERGMQLLVEVLTSRAASRQRKGRAGRTKPGKCYKVFTRRMETRKMPAFPVPEILRTPLEALFLQVKSMREDEDVKAFLSKAIDPPKVDQLDAAWKTLVDLQAVEGEDATSKLTALGRHMSSIPVDLRLAKMLVLGAIFKCLDPILSITAILSSKPLFLSPLDKRNEAQRARAAFSTGNSDLLTDAKAYAEASHISHYGALRSFCEDNFLSQSSVRDITSLRTDFMGALKELGFLASSHKVSAELNENSSNENLIKSIVLGGLHPRIARVDLPRAKFDQMMSGTLLREHAAKEIKFFDATERVFLHPGSVLFGETKISSGFLCYWAKNQTTKVFLRDATEVPLYGLLLFGGKVTVNHFSSLLMVGDGQVKMKAWTRIGVLINQLRRLLDASLQAQFDDPTAVVGGNEEVIKAMLALLASRS